MSSIWTAFFWYIFHNILNYCIFKQNCSFPVYLCSTLTISGCTYSNRIIHEMIWIHPKLRKTLKDIASKWKNRSTSLFLELFHFNSPVPQTAARASVQSTVRQEEGSGFVQRWVGPVWLTRRRWPVLQPDKLTVCLNRACGTTARQHGSPMGSCLMTLADSRRPFNQEPE